MYISKSEIVNRIRRAAMNYKNYLVGRTFLFVYDKDKYIEVIFKTGSFFHLTGVNSNLSAVNFYKHAIKSNALRTSEIFFDHLHPFDLVNLKTSYLEDLYKITITDIFIADNVITATAIYAFGITDLKINLCLGRDTDRNGNLVTNCFVPYSFRIEEIDNSKFDNLYNVEFILSKETTAKKYTNITFGEKSLLKDLPKELKKRIDMIQIIKEDVT